MNNNFNLPNRVAIDAAGDIFVSDQVLGVLELPAGGDVPSSGTPSVIMPASSFAGKISGIAVDKNGTLYVTQSGTTAGQGSITQIVSPNSSAPTLNVLGKGQLSSPVALTLDSTGNLYVADAGLNQLIKIVATAGSVSNSSTFVTSANFGSGLANVPSDVTVDPSGNVFVLLPTTIYSVREGRSFTLPNVSGSQLNGLTSDSQGDLYYGQFNSGNINGINKVSAVSGVASTTTSTVTLAAIPNSLLTGLVTDARGRLYGIGAPYETLFQYTFGAALNLGSVAAGSVTSAQQPPTFTFFFTSAGTINAPVVVTSGATGLDFGIESHGVGAGTCKTNGTTHAYAVGDTCTVNISFSPLHAGTRAGAVELLSTAGTLAASAPVYGAGTGPQVSYLPGIRTGTAGSIANASNQPIDAVADGNGNVYVAYSSTGQVVQYNNSGAAVVAAGFGSLGGLALDGAGNLYVSDSKAGIVRQYIVTQNTFPSTYNTLGGSSLVGLAGLAVDPQGNLYGVVATTSGAIVKFIANNGFVTSSSNVVLLAHFFLPGAIAVDSKQDVFFTNPFGLNVLEIPAGGTQTVVLDNVPAPLGGLAVDGVGNLFVESSNSILEAVAANGALPASPKVITIPTDSTTSNLGSLHLDPNGNPIYTNVANGGIDKINLFAPPSFTFPTATTVKTTDSTDGSATLTLFNNGTAPLTFTLPTLAKTTNPTTPIDFTIGNSSTCVQTTTSSSTASTLNAGSTCTEVISFAPTVSGTLSETLAFIDNNLNATAPYDGNLNPTSGLQTINLQGTGVQPPTIGLSGLPATAVTSGSTVTGIAVTFKDGSGNLVTTPITFNYSLAFGPSLMSGTGSTSTGMASLTFGPIGLPGTYTLTVTATGYTTATGSITVVPGPLASFNFSPSVNITAGTAGVSALFKAVDASGNTISSFSGTVAVTLSGPAGFSAVSQNDPAYNGVIGVSFTGPYTLAGTYTLTASSGQITGTSSFSVLPASVASASITGLPSGIVPSGTAIGPITVTLLDQYGNVATNSVNSVYYTLTGPAGFTTLNLSSAGTNGVVSFATNTPSIPGQYTLNITGNFTPSVTSFQVGQISPVVTFPAPSVGSISYGTPLGSILSGTASYNSTTVPGAFTYTATRVGGSPVAVTSATILGAGTYSLVATFTPTSTATYKTITSSPVPLTINQATTTTIVSASVAQQSLGYAFTLTATVTSPSGRTDFANIVTFSTGTRTLGTAPLVNGVATLTTATVTVAGANNITATYAADTNYLGSSSATPAVVTGLTPTFTVTLNAATLTAARGSTGTLTGTISAANNYNGTIALSCVGLAAYTNCSVTPASITETGINGPTTFTVSVSPLTTGSYGLLWLPATLLGGLLMFRRRQIAKLGYNVKMLMILGFLACAALTTTGCGGNALQGAVPGTYNFSVQAVGTPATGTLSPALTVTQSVSLTVQ